MYYLLHQVCASVSLWLGCSCICVCVCIHVRGSDIGRESVEASIDLTTAMGQVVIATLLFPLLLPSLRSSVKPKAIFDEHLTYIFFLTFFMHTTWSFFSSKLLP